MIVASTRKKDKTKFQRNEREDFAADFVRKETRNRHIVLGGFYVSSQCSGTFMMYLNSLLGVLGGSVALVSSATRLSPHYPSVASQRDGGPLKTSIFSLWGLRFRVLLEICFGVSYEPTELIEFYSISVSLLSILTKNQGMTRQNFSDLRRTCEIFFVTQFQRPR